MSVTILQGSALDVLRTLPSESVQVCVTSPPYFQLRAYGTNPQVWGGDPDHDHVWDEHVRRLNNRHAIAVQEGLDGKNGVGNYANPKEWNIRSDFCACGAWRGELGLEPTPALFIEHLVMIFEEVRRVLRSDGVCFVNLADSRSGSGKGPTGHNGIGDQHRRQGFSDAFRTEHVPAKNLYLIPQRFAIAMQDRGWIVRDQICWAKTSAMPESVRDRCTSAWEPIWMFTKSARYFWDAEAVRQPLLAPQALIRTSVNGQGNGELASGKRFGSDPVGGANLRNFWLLGPEPSRLAHYAGFPTEIPRRCILAATSEKGACPQCGSPWRRVTVKGESTREGPTASGWREPGNDHAAVVRVGERLRATTGWQPGCACDAGDPVPQICLDPFLGSGTTALVADRLGRDAIGVELNPEYVEMARRRIESDEVMFSEPVTVAAPTQTSMFEEVAAG